MQPKITITQIEDALLALPEYKGLIRVSENLRLLALYCASAYHADYLKLLQFTGYPADTVKAAVQKMKDNDLVKDGVIADSFLRARIKGGNRLVDLLFGKLSVKDAPAAKGKSYQMRDGGQPKSARIKAAALAQTGNFGVADLSAAVPDAKPADVQQTISVMRRAGLLRDVVKGTSAQRAVYAIVRDGRPASAPKKTVEPPLAPKPLPASNSLPARVPVTIAPVDVEVLPGPAPSIASPTLDGLQMLRARIVTDLEAIDRVLGIYQRGGI